MNSPVRVSADAAGNIIGQSTNPEWGYVRVVQEKVLIDDNGFLRKKEISALIQGSMEDLKSFNFKPGQEMPGKIIVLEATTPFNFRNPDRDLKVAGGTGIPCTIEGSPIYRKTRYTEASNAQDTLIRHDNVEELRAAYSTKEEQVTSTNEDFDL